MPERVKTLESVIQWLGAIAGLGTLAFAVFNMLVAQKRPTGTTTGVATKVLHTSYLAIATVIFILIGYISWIPLPIQLDWRMRLVTLLAGGMVFFPSLGLYCWGLRTLGENFNASSGFGVRLHANHQLVTNGPYAAIRHPMYLAVILAGWGGLLLYLTWAMLGFAVMMLGLIYRAHREELALAQEFGMSWEEYKQRVPGWIPRPFSSKRQIE